MTTRPLPPPAGEPAHDAATMHMVAAAAAELVGAERMDRLKEVLREQLCTVVDFDAFTFSLYDPSTGLLHFEAGRDGDLEMQPFVVPLAGTPSELVVRTRRSLLTQNSADPLGKGAVMSGRPRRAESAIRTPILTPTEVLGIISVQSHTPDHYTDADVELVETIAALAATAILSIRALEELRSTEGALRLAEQQAQDLAIRMRAVADTAARMIQTRTLLDLQAVVRDACERVLRLDYCTLGLYDPGTGLLRYDGSFDAGLTVDSPRYVKLAGTPNEYVIRERRSLVTLRSDDPRSLGASVVGTGRRSESVIRTPILAGDRVLGVLSVQSYTPDLYGQQDVEVLEALAAVTATGVLNIEHLHQQHELEEQLRQAQKMEAVGQLAGGIAHDFNNLLTAIEGNTSLVLSELPQNHVLRSELLEVQEAAARAAGLTRQLLTFGRQQLLNPRVLDLNEQVRKVQGLLRRLIPSNITIVTELEPAIGRISADESQVDQVLLNLVVNARDAMPDGGTITIATRNTTVSEADTRLLAFVQPGEYAVLEVCDSGVGMDEQTLGRVFEPFFSTKPMGRGTGLGLATVYGIVKQSGGCVTAASVPGEGSTFTVYLPRLAQDDAAAATPAPSPASRRGHETVLLVEDEASVRNLARRILERSGYTVLEASNGADALQVVASHESRIDLLLTDIMMPVMGGQVLAERLLTLDPLLPIVFMSGYAGDALDAAVTTGPRRGFVQKPFTPHDLTAAVRATLDAAAAG